MPQFLVPSITKASVISVATYNYGDPLLGFTVRRAVASNIATVTLDRAHGKELGNHVYINGLGDATYNIYAVIIAIPSSKSLSFALTHANEDVSDTAGAVLDPNSGKQTGFYLRVGGTGNVRYSLPGNVVCQSARRKVATNVATITTKMPHGLVTGNTIIQFGFADSAYNAAFTVASTPTPYTYTFALTHGDEDLVDGGGIIFDTIVKSFTAVTKFDDPEMISKIFTTGTAATSLVVGFSKDQRG